MKQNSHVKVVFIESTNTNVTLTVSIGYAQPSHTDVYKNGALIKQGNDNFDFVIGNATELIGKQLLVVTTVSDLPENPNQITTDHDLDIDKPNSTSSFKDAVAENEVVINSTRYFFYKK